jgi:hypothetical protein
MEKRISRIFGKHGGGGGKSLLVLAVIAFTANFAAAEESGEAGKVSLGIEFNASIISADSEGVVDSMTDSGFNEDETKIGLSYEGEFWGASASLKFGNEGLRFLSGEIGEMFAGFPLALDELYAWVKPFGEHFKFTGGIFENKDGIADYTDDIDDFDMGVFFPGEDGAPFEEPTEMTNTALVSGFLTDAVFGPVTVQFLLAPNYSKEKASELTSGLLSDLSTPVTVDADERFFRIGGRVIADVGVGTVSALFKTFQWPAAVESGVSQAYGNGPLYPDGTKENYNTFGAYFDLTAVENLGVSIGYTGFLPAHDAADIENVLWSGIDLRATWTGIEGLSLSSHNNISFAKGVEKDWMGLLGKDASFLMLYNAVGATKELTEKFSVNAEIANVFSRTDDGDSGELKFENFFVTAKVITRVAENAEFDFGLSVDFSNTVLKGGFGDDDDSLTVFSIPVGIKVSF